MTFDEIVSDICGRLDLTTADAIARVGLRVNRRYRRVTTSIGMVSTRRVSNAFAVTIGMRVQVITNVEKIFAIQNADISNSPPLREMLYEEMLMTIPTTGAPRAWAVRRVGASTVTVVFDSTFATATNLTIDGEETASTLSGSQIPAFPESFHDLLVFGAVADELRKKEKIALARDADLEYERILGELRLHIAISGFGDVVQGKQNAGIAGSCGMLHVGGGGGGSSTTTSGGIYVNVRDYGALGDGSNDTAAITAAINAIPATGGTVYFPNPPLYYACNLLIFRPKIRLLGEGIGRVTASENAGGLTAFDVTQPVVTVGGADGLCQGVQVENLEFNGRGVCYYGLKFISGSYSQQHHNLTFQGFVKKSLWIQSGTVYPCAYLRFSQIAIQPYNSAAHEHGIYIKQGSAGTFVEAISFDGLDLHGDITAGYALENAGSASLVITNSWLQLKHQHGVLLSQPSTNVPAISGGPCWLDSDSSSDTLASQNFATAGNPIEDFFVGHFSIDGKFDSHGTLMVAGDSPVHIPYLSLAVYPRLYGSAFLVDNANPRAQTVYISGETGAGRLNLVAPNEVIAASAIGVMLNYAPAIAAPYYQITNATGAHKLIANGTDLEVSPFAGGSAALRSDTTKFGLTTQYTLVVNTALGTVQFSNHLLIPNAKNYYAFAVDGTTPLLVAQYNASNNMFVGQGTTGTSSTLTGPSQVNLAIGGSTIAELTSAAYRPHVTNTITLGTASLDWKDVFTQNAVTVVSDARQKQDILPIDERALDAWADVAYVQYRWIDSVAHKGEAARTHFGVVAQRVQEVFAAHGLDAGHYGLFTYDVWEESAVMDGAVDGVESWSYVPAGDRYGIRPDTCLMLEAALQRRATLRLEAQLAELRSALQELKR